MEIINSTFSEIPFDNAGIVIMGCDLSSLGYRHGFIYGVTDRLAEEGVFPTGTKPEQVWLALYQTTTPVKSKDEGGRTDLIFVFNPDFEINMGRMALARLCLPDCSWIEDWLVNFADQYNSAPRGPHAAAHSQRTFEEDNEEDY